MNLFEQRDYKKWVNETLAAQPNRGRGQSSRIAEHLGVSPTIVTQVFRGDRELSPEQAIRLCEFFALSKLETRYFVGLVNQARAGTHQYRALIDDELAELRKQAREIGSHVAKSTELTEEAKATLYSNWYYLGAWSLIAIGVVSPQAISERLQVSPKKIGEALAELLTHGLIVRDEMGQFAIAQALIHLGSDSPHLSRHHQGWRLQAFRKYDDPGEVDTFYTAPVTLSREDALLIREKLFKMISEMVETVAPSRSEVLYCLCLDWFQV